MGKSKNVTTTERIDPAAAAYRDSAYNAATAASKAYASGSNYTGPRVADPSAGLQDAYAQSRDMAGLLPGAIGAYQGQIGGINDARNVFADAAGGFGTAQNNYGMQSGYANLGLGMLGSAYGARDPYAGYGAQAAGGLSAGLNGLGATAAAGAAGRDALMTQAQGTGAGISALQQGLRPGATMDGMAAFQNPYQEQVIDRVNADYGRQANMTSMGIRDNATRAGAFGGSRAAITEGAALGELGRGQADTIAGIRQAGYTDAANRAAADSASRIGVANNLASFGGLAGNGLSNLGLSASQGMVGAGFDGAQFGAGRFDTGMNRNMDIANRFVDQGNMANANMAEYGYRGASDLGAYGQNALGAVGNFGMGGLTNQAQYGGQMSAFQQAGYDAEMQKVAERDARLQGSVNMLTPFLQAPVGRTSTTPMQSNLGAGILGGITSAAGIFGKSNPWALAGGAILGAIK